MSSFFVSYIPMQAELLLQKYGEIIAEEVNVKEIALLDSTVVVVVTYVPLWQKIWWVFGKDTSAVIAAAKEGNAVLQHDGTLLVTAGENERKLAPDMYEIRYSGLEEDHQTIEWWVIVSLDMTITEELKKEGVARELSRFLNQMRKDAQFQIDEKVTCFYNTQDIYMQEVVVQFSTMLQEEALLRNLISSDTLDRALSTQFTSDEGVINFLLSR